MDNQSATADGHELNHTDITSDECITVSNHYIPSIALERYRTLAEVPVRYRHPANPRDVDKCVVIKVSAECSKDGGHISMLPLRADETQNVYHNSLRTKNRVDPSVLSRNTVLEVLHLEIYEDGNPFILLRLTITKDDFLILKREQRLLVDFDMFPGMLIQLLESCGSTYSLAASRTSDGPVTNLEHKGKCYPSLNNRKGSSSVVRWDSNLQSETRKDSFWNSSDSMDTNNCISEAENGPLNIIGSDENPKINEKAGWNCAAHNSTKDIVVKSDEQQLNLIALLILEEKTTSRDINPSSVSYAPNSTDSSPFEGTENRKSSSIVPSNHSITSALFSLVEMNRFKEITHLALRFLIADDDITKRHLAKRLEQSKKYSECLEYEMKTLEIHRKNWFNLCAEARNRYNRLNDQVDHMKAEMRKLHEDEIQTLIGDHDQQLQKQRNDLCEGRAKLETKLTEKIEALTSQRDTLSTKIEDLETLKTGFEKSEKLMKEEIMILKEKLGLQHDINKNLKSSNEELMTQKKKLESEIESLRSQMSTDQIELVTLRNQIKIFEEKETSYHLIKKHENDYKIALETSSSEIEKGNELIQKLQSALKKERSKNKEIVADQQSSLSSTHQLVTRIADLENKEMILSSSEMNLKKQVELFTQQLKEAKDTLEANRFTIESLESQLTERTVEAVLLSSKIMDPVERKFKNDGNSEKCPIPNLIKSSFHMSRNTVGNPSPVYSNQFYNNNNNKRASFNPLYYPSPLKSNLYERSLLPSTSLKNSFNKLNQYISVETTTTPSQSYPKEAPVPTILSNDIHDPQISSDDHQQVHQNADHDTTTAVLVTLPLEGELSFGRPMRKTKKKRKDATLPAEPPICRQSDLHQEDELNVLNCSTGTLESSGAPHFGSSRKKNEKAAACTTPSEAGETGATKSTNKMKSIAEHRKKTMGDRRPEQKHPKQNKT